MEEINYLLIIYIGKIIIGFKLTFKNVEFLHFEIAAINFYDHYGSRQAEY
jgi:hypothetical protein